MARQPARPPNGVQFSQRLLKTSVQNPFDTFTAPQFDNWVDDITSTIRNALSGKARGKARDPREGAGLDGLRRLFAQPGNPVDLDESLAADETDDQVTEGGRLQQPHESVDLTQGDSQDQEEMNFFSEDDEREPRARDAEAERYYGRESPAAADDEDQHETLDFNSIYANGAAFSETPASPAWSIEAEGNTTLRQDAGEYDEDYNEGDEYLNGEDYAEDGEYAEGDYYGDENEEGYYDEEAEPTAQSASHPSQTAAAPEVLEIDDDDDEDVSEQPPARAVHSAPAAGEDEEDELDDDDKENAVPARSPSIARSAPYAYSPSYSRRTPLSSVRGVSSGASPQPQPQPPPRPAEPEVFTISDDEDETEPTPADPLPPPLTADVAAPAPAQEAVATDQVIDELDLDSLRQLPTQAAPLSQEDSAMDLFSLTDLETRADEPVVSNYLTSGPADVTALDQDVAEFMSQATSGVLPLGMEAIDPAILAAEFAAFNAGIDAALEAQASAAQASELDAFSAGIDAAIEAQAQAAADHDEASAIAAFNAGIDAALEAQTPAPAAQASASEIVPVELSEIEKAATSDVASLTATALPQGSVEGEEGPVQETSTPVVDDTEQLAANTSETEPAAATAIVSTPPVTPSRLHIPTTPSRERGSPLFMSPGELPVVPGEFLNEEPEKVSHPPSPHLHDAGEEPTLPDVHDVPHFLDRDDIEKDGPTEDRDTVADADVEKAHPRLDAEEEPREDTQVQTDRPVELAISPAEAAALSLDEKKALLQRDDVDPFSLMGDDSLVAPGAVETPDEEDEDATQPAEEEADVVPEIPDVALGHEVVNGEPDLKPHDIDADASGESDSEERIKEITVPRSTGVSTPRSADADPAQQEHANGRVETQSTDVVLIAEENDSVDKAELPTDSSLAQQESITVTVDVMPDPEAVEARDSSSSVADILPSAMESVLALPSATSVPSPQADVEAEAAGEASSSKAGRKSRRGRPLAPTRSSTRIARTQSSQQVPMSAPKTRARPPNSARSEASAASASASASSSVTGSAYSRESSVVSTRGRRSKRDAESVHGSRESTVQPTARKTNGKGKGKGKAKQEDDGELQALAKEEEPSAPDPTPAQFPTRPPLLRTQTYRHYHGKKNASAGATPTWASLKWNSLLQPALALVRMTGASSSTADAAQAATPTPPAAVEPQISSTEAAIPATPDPIANNGAAEPSADGSRTDAKPEPESELPSSGEAKPIPEVVVPHLEDVAADTGASSTDVDIESKAEGARPSGLHLGALPSPLPSPSLPSPAVPPPPLPTPVEAPKPRGHASRPSLVIQDSFIPESGHMTRSNCRFHKISIPAAAGSSEVVQFVAPACAITNRELMEEEGIVDCGVATDIDHARTVIELEIAPDDVLHVLRRLVGLELLREGEVGFRLPDGETVESMRERMPTAANSIFHQYRKPESKATDGSSAMPHKKRKRASSFAQSQASTLTDLEATDGEPDKLDTPASRTRSRMGADTSSSPISPVDRRKRRRVEHEDEYRPTDADHALEVEDEQEDYAELATRPKKRTRKSGAAARQSVAPSPADTTASTPLPVAEEGDVSKTPGDEAVATASKPQKKAPRRKSRKRKAGVVDPAFKPGSAPASNSESEVEGGPVRKTAKAKRGKKRAAAEEVEQDGVGEVGSARPPLSKKRKVAAVDTAAAPAAEAENA